MDALALPKRLPRLVAGDSKHGRALYQRYVAQNIATQQHGQDRAIPSSLAAASSDTELLKWAITPADAAPCQTKNGPLTRSSHCNHPSRLDNLNPSERHDLLFYLHQLHFKI